MGFEEVLEQVGDYGKYQKRMVFVFLTPVAIIGCLVAFQVMFLLDTPDHWCYVQQLSHLSMDEQKHLIRPMVIKQGLSTFDRCNMYDIDYTNVSITLSLPGNDSSLLPTKKCDNGWTYDRSDFLESAPTKV